MILKDYEKKLKRNVSFTVIGIILILISYYLFVFFDHIYNEKRLNEKRNNIQKIELLKKDIKTLKDKISRNKEIHFINEEIKSLNNKCTMNIENTKKDLTEIFTKLSITYKQFNIDILKVEEDEKYTNLLNIEILVTPINTNIQDYDLLTNYQKVIRELVFIFLNNFKKELSIYNKKEIVKTNVNQISFTIIKECAEDDIK